MKLRDKEQLKQTINMDIYRSLWHKVKVQSAIDGVTMTQWVTDAIEKKLEKKK